MCISVLAICMPVFLVNVGCPHRLEEDIDSSDTTVADGCEPQWVWGIELRSFGRTVSAFSCWNISLPLVCLLLIAELNGHDKDLINLQSHTIYSMVLCKNKEKKKKKPHHQQKSCLAPHCWCYSTVSTGCRKGEVCGWGCLQPLDNSTHEGSVGQSLLHRMSEERKLSKSVLFTDTGSLMGTGQYKMLHLDSRNLDRASTLEEALFVF